MRSLNIDNNNLFDINNIDFRETLWVNRILSFPDIHLDINDMNSTIAVVEKYGKGCINHHDNKRDGRQDPSLWRKDKCIRKMSHIYLKIHSFFYISHKYVSPVNLRANSTTLRLQDKATTVLSSFTVDAVSLSSTFLDS